MPYSIKAIEQIAQDKRRGVLYITFNPVYSPQNRCDDGKKDFDYYAKPWNWDDCPKRQELLNWLGANDFSWVECDVSRYHSPSYLTYEGSIYVDTPFDLDDPKYLKLQERMECSDGSMVDSDVCLWFLSLERAEKVKPELGY